MLDHPALVLADAVTLRPGLTGGAERFAAELFGRLATAPRIELHICIEPGAKRWLRQLGIPDSQIHIVRRLPGRAGLLVAKFQVRCLARAIAPDVVWAPFNQPLLAPGIPEVLTIHDLSPAFYLREVRSLGLRTVRRFSLQFRLARTLRGAVRSAVVTVPSRAVRRSICEAAGSAPENIELIPEGGDTEAVRESTLWTAAATRSRRVLTISSGLPHKNIELVGEIARNPFFRGSGVSFVVAGMEAVPAEGNGWAPSVRFIRGPSDAELASLMISSACLLSPSRFEGFGLPLAEAMHLGLPIVASDIPPHRELAADGALYFDADDAEMAAHQLERVLTEPATATRLSATLRRRSGAFTWDNAARLYELLFLRVAGRIGREAQSHPGD